MVKQQLPAGSHGERLEKQTGGGCLMLFGLPFFAAGVFMLLVATGVLDTKIEGNQQAAPYVLTFMGLIFSLVGGVLMFGRAGITIDRTMNKVSRWWGILLPMKVTEQSLHHFKHIELNRERRKSGNSSVTVFPVRLKSDGTVKDIEYESSRNYSQARRTAETLSAYLRVNLEDISSGERVVRAYDKLDESLRDKLRSEGAAPSMLSRPHEMRSKVQENYGQLTIDIPSTGLRPLYLVFFIPALVFIGVVLLFFRPLGKEFGDLSSPEGIFATVFMALFLGIPILATLVIVMKKVGGGVSVTLDREKLAVRRKGLVGPRTIEIPVDELEELHRLDPMKGLGTGQGKPADPAQIQKYQSLLSTNSGLGRLIRALIPSGIVARSDRREVRFGQGLSTEELNYLHELLTKTLAE
jgi:hypothetical protein